jgi:hypothetical protein
MSNDEKCRIKITKSMTGPLGIFFIDDEKRVPSEVSERVARAWVNDGCAEWVADLKSSLRQFEIETAADAPEEKAVTVKSKAKRKGRGK